MTEFDATLNNNDSVKFTVNFGNRTSSAFRSPLPGRPGSKWYNGSGVPDPAIGIIGDYYLDNDSKNYYEKTDATTWTLRGNLASDLEDEIIALSIAL